ncbi:MAG: hypothetical protein U1E65_11695 [Myxococcota bacterium]
MRSTLLGTAILASALSACSSTPCEAGKLHLRLTMNDVALVSAAHRLELTVLRQNQVLFRGGFDLQPGVLDGVVEEELAVPPGAGALSVTAVVLDRTGGTVLRARAGNAEAGCGTRVVMDLTEPTAPLADAGVDLDAGPSADAGPAEDAGLPRQAFRRSLRVTTGSVTPDNGWVGYTVRATGLDSAAWILRGALAGDCSDLRVRFVKADQEGPELPRHVVGCGTSSAEIRFALPSGYDSGSFSLEYGAPLTPLPPTMTSSNVYLHYDEAKTDRVASYLHGRFDDWFPNFDDSLAFDAAEPSYRYDTMDDSISAYRLGLSVRDVYAEAEFVHRACYPTNMVTGLAARVTVNGTVPAEQTSDRFYAGARRSQEGCTAYPTDLDLVRGSRDGVVVSYEGRASTVPPMIWHREALAVFGSGEVHLALWDDPPGATPGWPSGAPKTSGTDPQGQSRPGDVAIVTAQDSGSLRNILVRRFVLPEPVVDVGAETPR